MLPILTKLFNNILISEHYPKKWCEAYIVPVPKIQDTSVPSNFRGISIMNCLAKLFNAVINKRIVSFLENKKKWDKLQIGFKKGHRTTDHMFIIRTLIEKYTKSSGKLYTCFIDFSKAFDRIDHLYLMLKLRTAGIGGYIYEVIKDMYINIGITLSVKSGRFLSNSFRSNIGVRQGDVLSPTLFNIFLNDLQEYLPLNDQTPEIGNTKIPYLLYADDLVLFSTSNTHMQNSMNALEMYCKKWNLKINKDKTKLVVFNTKGIKSKCSIKVDGEEIEETNTYKYLGVVFSSNGKFEEAKRDLLHRGYKAMFSLLAKFKLAKPSFQTSMHLFDYIIKPVLLYGADIWGDSCICTKGSIYNKLKNDTIEKCHLKFCRYTLNVNKHTSNIGIYGETGRIPISIYAGVQFIKYWCRIANIKGDDFNLLKMAYRECKLQENRHAKWLYNAKFILEQMSIDINAEANLSSINLGRKARYTFKEIFVKGWKQALFSDVRRHNGGNKLRCYRTFKRDFEVAEYLLTCKNIRIRSCLSRFRLSSHKLKIESDRYSVPRIPPEQRICTNCDDNICEDEFHFLITCKKYSDLRKTFYDNIQVIYNNFKQLLDQEKFIWLMSNIDPVVTILLGHFIDDCFKIRRQDGT